MSTAAGASAGPAADATTLLFVPATRPERVPKALAAGADLVVVDLEDAVAAEDKTTARASLERLLAEGLEVAVRVNAVGTPEHAADLALVRRHGCPVMLPKADAAAVAGLAAVDGLGPVIALVETARGVLEAAAVAMAPGVVRLALGHLDLALELDVAPDDRDALRLARSSLVLASAAAGLAAPVDGVTADVTDLDALAGDVRHARRLGLGGKLCLHPRQVEAVHAAFAPDPAELAWAERVLAAGSGGSGSGVIVVDGRMVDRPVLERARRVARRVPTAPETPDPPDPPDHHREESTS